MNRRHLPYLSAAPNYRAHYALPPIQYPPPLDTSSNRNNNVLQIRGLSPAVGYASRDSLFYGLGATSVHNYPFYTISYFRNEIACREVIQLMHQRHWPDLPGDSKRLRVEFLPPNQTESRVVNSHTACDSSLKQLIRQEQEQLFQSAISSNRPPKNCKDSSCTATTNCNNPTLPHFDFPKVSLSVIKRIGKHLLENSHFYYHVLVLMLQLNLKPPFDEDNSQDDELDLSILDLPSLPSKRNHDDLLCSDESEGESEINELPVIKSYNHIPMTRKVMKNLKTGFVGDKARDSAITTNRKRQMSTSPLTTEIAEVFEGPTEITKPKSFEIKVPKLDNDAQESQSTTLHDEPVDESVPLGNFGTLDPSPAVEAESEPKRPQIAFDLATLTQEDLISDTDLDQNRIPHSEWSQYKVFQGYTVSEPSRRLYVKNLHPRKTTIKELYCLFGKFVELLNESHLNSFDIIYMNKGNMRGQAFVTLPSEEIAVEALNRTNGYTMHGKPIVVAFSHTRKAHPENEARTN